MTQPVSISIVTPTLNQGAYIRQTIESVLAQQYPNLEYLVLDGGSSDATLDILTAYGSAFRWRSEPDRGQTNAINKGWNAASGEILAWLNSDDLLLPGALEAVGRFFAENPGVDIVYGDADYIDETGRHLAPYPAQAFDPRALVVETKNFLPQPATFLRRRVFEKLGPLDEDLKYVMDFDYWLRSALHFNIRYVPRRWAALRLHSSAKSVASLGQFAGELVTIYRRFLNQEGLPAWITTARRRMMANILTRAMDCAFWAGDVPQARRYALQGWRYAPWRPRKLWGLLLLGKTGYRLAQKYLPNPYLFGPAAVNKG